MNAAAGNALQLSLVRPYVSLLVLECLVEDVSQEHAGLAVRLRALARDRADVVREHLTEGITGGASTILNATGEGNDLLHVNGFVSRAVGPPSWMYGGEFRDVSHSLVMTVFLGRFVAITVNGDGSGINLQRWLDQSPVPPYQRIDPHVLEAAFLAGDAKSMWLDGVHSPRVTKANSKQLSGPSLQEALDPFDDSTFSLSAARAEITDVVAGGPDGNIGVNPGESRVWLKRSEGLDDYLSKATWVLERVRRQAEELNPPASAMYPWLATRVAGLSNVHRAFHVSVPALSDVSPDDVDVDTIAALALLEDAELVVMPGPGASFSVGIGSGGSIGGWARFDVSMDGRRVRIAIGWDTNQVSTDQVLARPVLDALRACAGLLRIHYESGHAIDVKGVWTSNATTAAFSGWRWLDFSGFDVATEKPLPPQGGSIHSAIGAPGDTSLFGWIATNLRSGYLVCDDGAGEVADFVHLDHDETLSIIHVKSAGSARSRNVAVQRYEGVVSQAVKNLALLRGDALLAAMRAPTRAQYATWYEGVRQADRAEFLEFLEARRATSRVRVVVLQPQVNRAAYDNPANAAKVNLVNTLLNSARGSATGIGADFEVWSAI